MTREYSSAVRRVGLLLVMLSGLLLVGGCSSFSRDWKAVAAKPVSPGSIEGAWQGTWLSHSNGHRGGLRAIIEKTPDGRYQTHFHATYWKLFSAEYKVNLQATERGGRYELSGREDLGRCMGWKLGEYRYAGIATTTNFSCNYQSSSDGGVFDMRRSQQNAQ